MSSPLIVTKFFIPTNRETLVSRPRLEEHLNQGLDRKMTLVSSPAGFGKTTLVSHWVDNLMKDQTARVAWLSLDEDDKDPVRFLTYLAASLNRASDPDKSLGKGALNILQSPTSPGINDVLISLINDLAESDNKYILVLDDYHLTEEKPIDKAIGFLLDNNPPQLHIVVVTREDPSLSLGRLRARNALNELRAADLRFSSTEAADFLNDVMGLNLSSSDIADLETRTEGWIAGLQLAAISMQGRKDHTEFIKAFTGGHRLVLDFLIEEVIDQQPAEIQSFLMQTSILDRMTGSLCDAVTGQDNGQETLELLDRINLFIVPLDNERRWYRYHHLFSTLLKKEAQRKKIDQLSVFHRRASDWYEENGLLSDAINHVLAAGDYDRVANLAELAWPAWRGYSQSLRWLRWVKDLPEDLIRVRPVLCVAMSQALLNSGDLERAEARLIDAENGLKNKNDSKDQQEGISSKIVIADNQQFQDLHVTLATTRAYHAQAVGNIKGTVKYAEQVLDLLPEEEHFERGAATALLGLAYWANGDLESADRTFSRGLSEMQISGNLLGVISGSFVLADIRMTLGRLSEAFQICEYGLRISDVYGEAKPLGTEDIHTALSIIYLERNKSEDAVQHIDISKRLGDQVDILDWRYRWCIAKANLEETQGDLDAALDLLDQAISVFVRTPLPVIRPISAMKARIWVKQGRLAEAQNWVLEQDLSINDNLNFLQEYVHITFVRVLFAQYKKNREEELLRQITGLLERLRNSAENGKRIRSIIEILNLQALVSDELGESLQTLKLVEQALTLGKPEGFIRIFVDEGLPMAKLLYEALKQEIEPDYVKRILAAFPLAEPKEYPHLNDLIDQSGLIDPISEREIEVLQLLAKGLTNKVIAERLVLSIHTVKTHTRNIYSKLAVNNRTQAVVKAKSLGILPST